MLVQSLTSHSSVLLPLVGLPGLISLLLHTSPTRSFHQRASSLNMRAHKTLWATPERNPQPPPHPELKPRPRSRAPAAGTSRTSCSVALSERDWRTEGPGYRATRPRGQDSPQKRPDKATRTKKTISDSVLRCSSSSCWTDLLRWLPLVGARLHCINISSTLSRCFLFDIYGVFHRGMLVAFIIRSKNDVLLRNTGYIWWFSII